MVNINPNRESCMEYMKELIRKGYKEYLFKTFLEN